MKTFYSLILTLFASSLLLAQQPAASSTPRSGRCQTCTRSVGRAAPLATPVPTPVTAEFFIGEARVDVTRDETVVKLAMAQHASVLIELPASDGPRYIIPGDPEMATVDQKALEHNKRAIVVRPGTLFVPPMGNAKARRPAATMTAQMRSGLVVTFLFYPVLDLAQNVHRCVLNYSRDEVVARRRALGLAVNLEGTGERGEIAVQSTAPSSISVETVTEESENRPRLDSAPSGITAPRTRSSFELTIKPFSFADPSTRPTRSEKLERPSDALTLVTLARDALQAAINQPNQFKKWTKAVRGLALSVVQLPEPAGSSVVIVAVKNKTGDSVKITPGTPDLFVEMLGDDGKPVNVESIKQLHTEMSDSTGFITAGGTTYYALAYVSPVLGARQRLKLNVSQTNAADEPASIVLATSGR